MEATQWPNAVGLYSLFAGRHFCDRNDPTQARSFPIRRGSRQGTACPFTKKRGNCVMRECDVVYFTIVSRSNQTSVIFLPFAGRVSFAARTVFPARDHGARVHSRFEIIPTNLRKCISAKRLTSPHEHRVNHAIAKKSILRFRFPHTLKKSRTGKCE